MGAENRRRDALADVDGLPQQHEIDYGNLVFCGAA